MAEKQKATFLTVEGWGDYGDNGVVAFLTGVGGHPLLGDQPTVTTSGIVGIKREKGIVVEIETMNTVYTRAEVSE